jgi:hypothetical protein
MNFKRVALGITGSNKVREREEERRREKEEEGGRRKKGEGGGRRKEEGGEGEEGEERTSFAGSGGGFFYSLQKLLDLFCLDHLRPGSNLEVLEDEVLGDGNGSPELREGIEELGCLRGEEDTS